MVQPTPPQAASLMRQSLNSFKLTPGSGLSYAVLAVTLSFLYLGIFVFQARVDIRLELDAPQATFFKVYWAAADEDFNEKRMAYAQLDARQNEGHLYIDSLANINRIRIDPIEYPGRLALQALQIKQYGYTPIVLRQAGDYPPLKANNQIRILTDPSSDGLVMETTGHDGHIELDIVADRKLSFPLQQLLTLAGILLGLALAMRWLNPLFIEYRFVPWLLTLSFLFALTMALTTGLHLHPDEMAHLSAVEYYARHLLPPSLASEEVASSFSIYGRSRLSQYEIYYQLAGYFQALPVRFSASPVLFARAFGLLIFLVLIIFSFSRKSFRPFALPMLISAQIWYLYSYTNSDAFALALVIFVSFLIARPDSMLTRFLTEEQPRRYAIKLVAFGLLFGGLLLLKLNYYVFILFLVLYLLWRIRRGDFPERKRLWLRVALLVLIATSLYAGRVALDIHANGWQSAELQMQLQEKHALDAYKPSTPLDEKNPMLNLKERGFSLGYILVSARWFEKSFKSAFGMYGFADFYAAKSYYDLVRTIGLLLLLVLIITALRGRHRAHLSLLLIVALCSGILVSLSIWNSWTTVFQSQGRYLLPILPMLGILYYHLRPHSPEYLVEWLCVTLYLLAAYSFVFTGLANMSTILS